MKVIDGEPAHINKEIEGDMSPEDIKKYGAGTTNPITGKKEYFLRKKFLNSKTKLNSKSKINIQI